MTDCLGIDPWCGMTDVFHCSGCAENAQLHEALVTERYFRELEQEKMIQLRAQVADSKYFTEISGEWQRLVADLRKSHEERDQLREQLAQMVAVLDRWHVEASCSIRRSGRLYRELRALADLPDAPVKEKP